MLSARLIQARAPLFVVSGGSSPNLLRRLVVHKIDLGRLLLGLLPLVELVLGSSFELTRESCVAGRLQRVYRRAELFLVHD